MNSRENNFADMLSERAIWVLTLAKIVLVSWFFLAMLASNHARAAEETPSCSGNDLLERMKVEKPDAYKRIMDQANTVTNAHNLFWKVEKPGATPSWLLGTMHVSDPRVTNMPQARMSALEAADTVIIETTDGLDEEKAAAKMQELASLALLTDGSTLESKIPKNLWPKLETATGALSMPFFVANRLQPWFVTAAIAIPPCDIASKKAGNPYLDKKIAEIAVAKGHNLVGLETMKEQLEALASMPESFQVQSLIETLRMDDKLRNDMVYTMINLYIGGNMSAFMPLTDEISREISGGRQVPESKEFEQKVIINRNHIMAERARQYLDKGNAFMAVGALHLPGNEGVVELLRKAGYTLTPVN